MHIMHGPFFLMCYLRYVSQMIPLKSFQILINHFSFDIARIWCDNGPHFHCDLFVLYTELFGKLHSIAMVCNFHEAGEGRCWLDRFFGSLVALEKAYLLHFQDISGKLIFPFLCILVPSFFLISKFQDKSDGSEHGLMLNNQLFCVVLQIELMNHFYYVSFLGLFFVLFANFFILPKMTSCITD